MTARCRDCKYLGTDRGLHENVGLCFRFPAQYSGNNADGLPNFSPPAVGLDTSWCGEFVRTVMPTTKPPRKGSRR